MPLFGKRQSGSDDLFLKVLTSKSEKISNLFDDDLQRRMHEAWVIGGSIAAGGVVDFRFMKRAWGRGDENKAIALTEVFALAMASRWYRALQLQFGWSREDQQPARVTAFTNILTLFNHLTEEGVRDSINLDIQFNYDSEIRDGHLKCDGYDSTIGIEEKLLQLKALQAVGDSIRFDLTKVAFPESSIFGFLGHVSPFPPDPVEDGIFIGMLVTAEESMFKHYEDG